ncbi:MAG: PAS domain S-box protein [Nitrospirota bacterium]
MRRKIVIGLTVALWIFVLFSFLFSIEAGGPSGSGSRLVSIGTLLSFVLFFWVFSLFNREVLERRRAEEALRKSERRLWQMVENLPVGAFYREDDSVFFNRAVEELTGYKRAEMTTLDQWFATMYGADAPVVRSYYEEDRRKGFPATRTVPLTRKDGSIRYIEFAGYAFDKGEVWVLHDITERKRVEEELARLSRKYELILESAGEGIYGLDRSGRHTIVNRAAVAMLGYPAEEVIGRKSHPLWHHTRADGTPYPEEECRIYATIRDGVMKTVDDEVFWRKDGTSFPVEYTATPIVRDGVIDGVVVTFRDITERKQIEGELIESEANLRTILDSVYDAIFIHDMDGNIIDVNRKMLELYGVERDEATRLSIREDYSAPDNPLDELPGIWRRVKGGETQLFEWRARRPHDGSVFTVEVFLRTITLRAREVILASVRDISERKRAEERLAKYVNELEQRNREIELLAEMNSLLQASLTAGEISLIIARSIRQLFSGESGIIYLLDRARSTLESIAVWGDIKADGYFLSPRECWALRLGRTYLSGSGRSEMLCPHTASLPDTAYLCVPMIAQGEILGMLFLQFNAAALGPGTANPEEERGPRLRSKQRLAEAAAESIALSLANFRLRETLYAQSIRDPLTGLFNRRYLDELLEKELHRVLRRELPLSVILLDIDHFKLFNDTFGHEAGDLLLRELGAFLARHIRAEDFACRYGGEEFVLVLPETALEDARQRAEELRRAIKELTVRYRERILGPVTVSMGVAVFPKHGERSDELLRASDAALYRAKAEGRDRVIVY